MFPAGAKTTTALVCATLVAGCTVGEIRSSETHPVPRTDDPLASADGLGASGARRLSKFEYARSVQVALGVVPAAEKLALMPGGEGGSFDNDYEAQFSDDTLILALEEIAKSVSEQVIGNPAALPCSPVTADEACLTSIVDQVGPLMLRRPITDFERSEWTMTATELVAATSNPSDGVSLVLRVLLQHPEFVFRTEVGEPTDMDGIVRLTGYELASRMSFLLWGSGPDRNLLNAAQEGRLHDATERAGIATQMLADARFDSQVLDFAGQWLGFRGVSGPLGDDMRAQTSALIEAQWLEGNGPALGILTAEQTELTPALAAHYGIGQSGTVVDPTGLRVGVLSHASFLRLGAKFGDTSPTRRGRVILERFLCQEIKPPNRVVGDPVNIDEPPGDDTQCKTERYQLMQQGGCVACHGITDPIGFGLERFDADGAYRQVQTDKPECAIPSGGTMPDGTAFNGPGELGALLAADPRTEACLAKQLLRFTIGRRDRAEEAATVQALGALMAGSTVREALLEIVTSAAFEYRVVEPMEAN